MPFTPILNVTIALPFTSYMTLFTFDILCLLSSIVITQQLLIEGGVRDKKTYMRRQNNIPILLTVWALYGLITVSIICMMIVSVRGDV